MAEWIKQWNVEVQKTPREGIYRLRSGGYLLVARVTDPRTKARQWLQRAVQADSIAKAQRLRDEMIADARDRTSGRSQQKTSFGAYAISLYGRKMVDGTIGSVATRERWDGALKQQLVPAFGTMSVEEIRRVDIENWKSECAKLVAAGKYKPTTTNGWQRVLLTILRSAVAEFELDRDPTRGVKPLSESDHATYTSEDPNALTTDQARAFISTMRAKHPQHYAMTLLGFVTGLRPSTLRPMRCRGASPDVLWKTDAILVRRSNARGQSVRETTKTKVNYTINLPAEVIGVLAGHVALVNGPPLSLRWGKAPLWWRDSMEGSDLLFPARHGGFLSRSVLDKPFAAISKVIGLGFLLTPRGMRRTFQDLARAAQVHDVVTRSISGHATAEMQGHYSTAQAEEQRVGIRQMLYLVQDSGPKVGAKVGAG